MLSIEYRISYTGHLPSEIPDCQSKFDIVSIAADFCPITYHFIVPKQREDPAFGYIFKKYRHGEAQVKFSHFSCQSKFHLRFIEFDSNIDTKFCVTVRGKT